MFTAAASGEKGGETLVDNLWLAVPGLVAFGGAVTSMIAGLIGLFTRRERSAAVIVTTVLSTLVFLFVALSLIFG